MQPQAMHKRSDRRQERSDRRWGPRCLLRARPFQRIAHAVAAAGLAGAVFALAAPSAGATGPGPYFSAPLQVHRTPDAFGQTPTWTRAGDVLSNESDRAGIEQVYRSHLDGSRMRCLTCGRVRGPNGFPEQRPEGDWILFCSMGAQPENFGGPCLGGYGSDLYVMRPDGSHVTRLTISSDPAGGARYDTLRGGVPYDNYHAYWSPNGRHLVWTRTEAFPLAAGGQRWQIMLADFVDPAHGRPHLANVRVVGPAFGVYETQAWAPDGSGFLFTAFGPRRSPFQSTPPGWMHLELYYMRLYGRGASPAHPRVAHLTDDNPAYEEQATFTPDMREVIVMSSRARPGTWYQTVITAAQWLGFDAPDPGSAGTPMFLADFSDPKFTSDLYMVDLATGAVRQMTAFHHVIPEFGWNPTYTKLLWTEVVGIPGKTVRHITRVASFAGISAAQQRVPRATPSDLFGAPIDLARVRGAASGPGQVRTTDGRAGSLVPEAAPASLARNLAAAGLSLSASSGLLPARAARALSVPPVVVSYVTLLLGQLRELADLAAGRLQMPSF